MRNHYSKKSNLSVSAVISPCIQDLNWLYLRRSGDFPGQILHLLCTFNLCLVSMRRNCFKQITYKSLFTYNMISPGSSHMLGCCDTHPLYFIRYYGIYFCSQFSNVWTTLNISVNYDDIISLTWNNPISRSLDSQLGKLTHFQLTVHLLINQVVGFASKMFEKHLWKSDI